MYFKSLFILVFSFLFIACSSKAPEIKKEDELTQANKCQILEKRDHKLKCYNKLLDTNSFAQLRIGIYFAQKKEYKKSLDLLNKSYESKNPYSNLALAFMYFNGFGVKQDLKESHNLLQDTKDINPNASYQLARFYLQGIYVKKDANKGIEFLEKAANNNLNTSLSEFNADNFDKD